MDIKWYLVVTYALAIIIEIGLPVALAFLFAKRFKVAWAVILTGVVTFIASQVVHIPVLQIPTLLYQAGVIHQVPSQWPTWAYALYLGILAGLCEETARLVGFKILKKKAQGLKSGLALGVGHGGIESVIIGGLVLVNVAYSLLYNPAVQLAHGVSQDEINGVMAQLSTLWAIPWHMPLAGAVERITAISAHLLMSVLVWKTAVSGKAWGYPLAILYHTVLDGASVYLSALGLTAWQLEACLCAFLVVNVLLIWRFWVQEKRETAAVTVTA